MSEAQLIPFDETAEEIDAQIDAHRAANWDKFDNQLKGFAIAYVQTYDHRLAAKQAHLDESQGIQLIRNPLVKALVSDLVEQKRIRTDITDDMVATMWVKVLPKLLGEEEVNMVTATGIEIMAKKFFASETVAALREMSKSTKFYADGSGQGGIDIKAILINGDMQISEASNIYRDMMNG